MSGVKIASATNTTPAANDRIPIDRPGDTTARFSYASSMLRGMTGAINPKDPAYGATGDGVSNDSAAMLAALQAAEDSSELLYIPPGTYLCNLTYTTNKFVRIVGAGVGQTILKPYDTGSPVISMSDYGPYTASYRRIEHLQLQSSSKTGTGIYSFTGIVDLFDVRISGFAKGYYNDCGEWGTYHRCTFYQNEFGFYSTSAGATGDARTIGQPAEQYFYDCIFWDNDIAYWLTNYGSEMADTSDSNAARFEQCQFLANNYICIGSMGSSESVVPYNPINIDQCWFETNNEGANPTYTIDGTAREKGEIYLRGGHLVVSNSHTPSLIYNLYNFASVHLRNSTTYDCTFNDTDNNCGVDSEGNNAYNATAVLSPDAPNIIFKRPRIDRSDAIGVWTPNVWPITRISGNVPITNLAARGTCSSNIPLGYGATPTVETNEGFISGSCAEAVMTAGQGIYWACGTVDTSKWYVASAFIKLVTNAAGMVLQLSGPTSILFGGPYIPVRYNVWQPICIVGKASYTGGNFMFLNPAVNGQDITVRFSAVQVLGPFDNPYQGISLIESGLYFDPATL